MRSSSILAPAAGILAFASSASANVVTDWNGTAVDLARTHYTGATGGPNPATRALAIAHLAAYDAVNAIDPTHEPYLEGLEADLPASADAAAAQAFHDTLVALFPAAEAALDADLAANLDAIEDGDAEDNGVALGKAAAAAILAARASDNASGSATLDDDFTPGKWRKTPRANLADPPLDASLPHWGTVTPFALESADQFDPGAPPALDSAEYTLDYNEVKLLGAKTSAYRTAEQTKIATFWAQPTHVPFNAIARSLAKQDKLSVADTARLFALLNLALADSRIAVWQAKYTYTAWRPITAIQTITPEDTGAGGEGGQPAVVYDDENPDTVQDAAWVPFLETPNHPEYVSGHSATGAAGAAVLSYWFGDDRTFSVGSDSAPGFTRTFDHFSDAADQNAQSRVYGGIHFRFSDDRGLALGAEIAAHVVDHYLLELDTSGGSGGEGGAGGSAPDPSGGSGGKPPASGGTNGDDGSPDAVGGASSGSSGSGGTGGSAGKASTKEADSGCSCTTAPHSRTSLLGWLTTIGLAAGLARRHRRRNSYS